MDNREHERCGRVADTEGGTLSANATRTSAKSDPREVADGYRGEVFRMGRYRVAVCRDGLQWLFQRQRIRFAPGRAAWDTLGYCTTRMALIRLHRAHGVPVGDDLAALSPHVNGRVGHE